MEAGPKWGATFFIGGRGPSPCPSWNRPCGAVRKRWCTVGIYVGVVQREHPKIRVEYRGGVDVLICRSTNSIKDIVTDSWHNRSATLQLLCGLPCQVTTMTMTVSWLEDSMACCHHLPRTLLWPNVLLTGCPSFAHQQHQSTEGQVLKRKRVNDGLKKQSRRYVSGLVQQICSSLLPESLLPFFQFIISLLIILAN